MFLESHFCLASSASLLLRVDLGGGDLDGLDPLPDCELSLPLELLLLEAFRLDLSRPGVSLLLQ